MDQRQLLRVSSVVFSRQEHRQREVTSDHHGSGNLIEQRVGQIASAAAGIQDAGAGFCAQTLDRFLSPPEIDETREEAIEHIVTRRDFIEERLDLVPFLVEKRMRTLGCRRNSG